MHSTTTIGKIPLPRITRVGHGGFDEERSRKRGPNEVVPPGKQSGFPQKRSICSPVGFEEEEAKHPRTKCGYREGHRLQRPTLYLIFQLSLCTIQ